MHRFRRTSEARGGWRKGAGQKGEEQGRERVKRESQRKALTQRTIHKAQRNSGGCGHVATTRETISQITQPNRMYSTVQGKELSVSVFRSLTHSQSDQFPLTNTPPRKLVFPLLEKEFMGRLLKNKIKQWTHQLPKEGHYEIGVTIWK